MRSKRGKITRTAVPLPRPTAVRGLLTSVALTSNGGNDGLRGAAEVRSFLNSEVFATPVTLTQTYHLIETGGIPAGKLGGLIISSKAKIREHFAELTAGVRPEPPRSEARTPRSKHPGRSTQPR
jgi:hypothetical protein